jgi:hypothetical protein
MEDIKLVMGKNPTSNNSDAQFYRIRVKGYLDESWSEWFDGLIIQHEANGTTLLNGYITDQSALFGILLKIQNLALGLISVNIAENTETNNISA